MTRLLYLAILFCGACTAASACTDGTLRFVPGGRCRRYAECEDGAWYLKECKLGQSFDYRTLRCRPVREVGRCLGDSKCTEGIAYSYPENDRLYYKCINNRISVQFCGAMKVFDHDLQDCRYEIRSRELSRVRREVGDGCTEGSRRRDGKSCKKYLECVNGQEVSKTCVDCMNFDDETQTCRFVFITPCGDVPTPPPSTTTIEPETKTEPPVTTPSPEPTTEPATTPSPEPTTEPATTPSPEPTTDPATTPLPEPTTEPATTPSPDPTTEPATTPSPDPTTEPATTPSPEPTTEPPTTTTEPSTTTAEPCKEGERIGVKDPNCKAYRECKKGVWVDDSCGWLKEFDAIQKECLITWFHKIHCTT